MCSRPAEFTFTVFVPTYNRARTLPRTLASIEDQSYRDFEVIVVDDGSMDGTGEIVEAWRRRQAFPVEYLWQRNAGKVAAQNRAVTIARGRLFIPLDSDDQLTPRALEILLRHWRAIPEEERGRFAGVEGLCEDLQGNIVGDRYPQDVIDSDHLEMNRRFDVGGDKKYCIRTDLLRAHPYPVIEGETFMRENLLTERLAHHYRFRFVNEVIQRVEYRPDGLSSNVFALRMRNTKGLRLYWEENANIHREYLRLGQLLRCHSQYVRYALHSGVGYLQQWRAMRSKLLWFAAVPTGTLEWLADRLKKRRYGHVRAS